MRMDHNMQVEGCIIPVYVQSGAGDVPAIVSEAIGFIFETIGETGGSVRLANIRMFGGQIEFRKPISLTASRDACWTISSPELRVHGTGATIGGAMDSLISAVATAMGLLRNPGIPSDDPLKAAFAEYAHLDRPCPDPDAKTCGE